VLIHLVTFLGISVFGSLIAHNKFEDLNEFKLSKMIEQNNLELICIKSFFILESPRAEMCMKQPLNNNSFTHF
jgi:hypothetical protein